MISNLFDSSTINVLEQVVNFTQSRHNVLAGNIANIDTPGYRVADLPADQFQSRLKEAINQRDRTRQSISLGNPRSAARDPVHDVSDDIKGILYHDDSNGGVEWQVAELLKNQGTHNTAIAIMTNQFRLLQAAISERV